MAVDTPYFLFDRFDDGEVGWSDRANWSQVDEEVPRYGPLADRPAASADNAGRIYIVTDAGSGGQTLITQSDGASWIVQGVGESGNVLPEIHSFLAYISRLGKNLDAALNTIRGLGAIQFRDANDRVIYGGGSGLFVKRSYGTAATLTKQWSPPESQGGRESTYALVVGDDDAYVYDMYNNAGYTVGPRAARWGLSLKHQNSAEARPYVIDFDNSALGGTSKVDRFKLNPIGDTVFPNRPTDFGGDPVKGLQEIGVDPAPADLQDGEWAFSSDHDGAGNPAWLYKPVGQTFYHYWTPDGQVTA